MRKVAFQPCIPTRRTEVPSGPDWIHEIKHDGYRLIVQREGKRVRLFMRNWNGERSPDVDMLTAADPKPPLSGGLRRFRPPARWGRFPRKPGLVQL